jgi:hypothetical protein
MSQKLSYFVLPNGGGASVAGDAIFKGGYLKIGGTTAAWLASMPAAIRNLSISANGLKNGFFRAYAAEVLRVITITPTAANSTDYRITLSAEKGQAFDNNLPNEIQTVFTHSTAATGATATTIGDAFRAAINNHPYWSTRVNVTGTTTIIITARAGFPIFSAGVGQLMSLVVTTPGSPQFGQTGAQLLASGFPFSADIGIPVVGTNYDIFSFEIGQPTDAVLSPASNHRIVFAVVPGGNNATFITTLAGLLTK